MDRRSARDRSAALVGYVAIAFAWSWAWWWGLAVSGDLVGTGQDWPTHLPGLLGPALAALVVTAWTDGRPGLQRLGRAVARPPRDRLTWLLLLVTLALWLVPSLWHRSGAAPGAAVDLAYSGAPATQGVAGTVLVLAYVLVVNGLGEELGWRGFLADRLLDRHGVGVTALLVWVVWAAWHLPVFWVVADFAVMGPARVVGWLFGLGCGSVVLTWLYVRNARSVLTVALWHVAYNLTTATDSTPTVAAMLSTTLVVLIAVAVLVGERRRGAGAPRPGEGVPGHAHAKYVDGHDG
jgi:membrane protease YdiL (CAAX protease family)